MAAMTPEQQALWSRLQLREQSLGTDVAAYISDDSSTPLDRKITVQVDGQLDKEKLTLLAMAYKLEQTVASTFSNFLNDISNLSEACPTIAEALRLHNMQGVKELLTHKTDALSDLTQLTRLQKPTDVNELRHGGLLDQVYERCTKLNSNDLDALSRALNTTSGKVGSWMQWKTKRTQHLQWAAADNRLAVVWEMLDNDARTFKMRAMGKAGIVQTVPLAFTFGDGTDDSYESNLSGSDKAENGDGESDDGYESDPMEH